MFQIPQLAPWNGMHVLLVHFPIALLIFTPVMIAAAIIFRKWGRQFAAAAGFVLLAGTIAAQVAVMSGDAAEDLAKKVGIEADKEASELLEEHSGAGEYARNLFVALSILYWGYLAVTGLSKKSIPVRADVAVLLLFFLLTAAGALVIVNTGHMGGLLVHKHGILAPMDAEAAAAAAAAAQDAGSGDAGGSDEGKQDKQDNDDD